MERGRESMTLDGFERVMGKGSGDSKLDVKINVCVGIPTLGTRM